MYMRARLASQKAFTVAPSLAAAIHIHWSRAASCRHFSGAARVTSGCSTRPAIPTLSHLHLQARDCSSAPARSQPSSAPTTLAAAVTAAAAPTMADDWVRVERKGAYALVVLRREPVNTMNLGFWQRLAATLEELEADPQVRGAVFLSGLRRDVFTAGNDIGELYAPLTSKERYREFWVSSNVFLARLYASPLVTVAAIRGACPAGGCCLSMCCDYRVMTEAGHIGLNEVALGISVPKMWAALMARIIGAGPAERLLQFAVLLTPQALGRLLDVEESKRVVHLVSSRQEAKDLGLIDDIAPKDGLLAAAEAAMEQMLQAPDGGRQMTKRNIRGDFAAEWEAFCEGEVEGAWAMLSSAKVAAALGGVLERLSGGRKPPPSRL